MRRKKQAVAPPRKIITDEWGNPVPLDPFGDPLTEDLVYQPTPPVLPYPDDGWGNPVSPPPPTDAVAWPGTPVLPAPPAPPPAAFSDEDWIRPAPPAPPPQPPTGPKGNRPAPVLAGDDGTFLSAPGYALTRKERKEATRAAAKAARGHGAALVAERKARYEELKAEQANASYLPKGGEHRAHSGKSYRKFAVTPHRATSEILAGAYPFLAEEGLGNRGALIGQDSFSGTAFCFDPWQLYSDGVITNPNIFLAGQIGRGKSALSKSLAVRYLAFGRSVYVPGDPKGEWSVVTRAMGGQVIHLSPGSTSRLNPLDAGHQPESVSDAEWQAQVTASRQALVAALATATLGRALEATERTALDVALAEAVRTNTVPVLPHVVAALHTPPTGVTGASVEELVRDGRDVAHALGRLVTGDLAGLFDAPSTVRFDPGAPMVSLDMSDISGSDTLIGLVMTCASSWFEAALRDPNGGQRLVVYDEAWRLLSQPALLGRMQAQWKLSRAWGLANLMVVHRTSDLEAVGATGSATRGLAQGLLADTATRILYNEPSDEAAKAGLLLGLTSEEVSQLPLLDRGEGLWRVNERSFIVRHLLTASELELFDTNARM